MPNPDQGYDAFRAIAAEFEAFKAERGRVSEADTRVKIIDRILTEALGWRESAITREDHVTSGYIDYVLHVQGRPYVAVEAKREGIAFVLPMSSSPIRTLRIDGALSTDIAVRGAIDQVRGYCDDSAIRYAVATNGYAWLVFRAIREDMPWRKGHARIFPSVDYIQDHFTEFWNLLSHEAISKGSLDAEFSIQNRAPRKLLRVVDRLFNSDLPLQRNRLHAQLHPLITTVFENIADQDQLEILQSCYVHSQSLRIVANDINVIITDAIPRLLQDQGTQPVEQGEASAGNFGIVLARTMPTQTGELFLLLGGIGSGKTTFLRRYQRTVGAELLNSKALWFHIDFLESTPDLAEMEPFAWRSILEQLRAKYVSPHLETRRNIKRAFKDNIEALEQTALRGLRAGSEEYEKELSPYLAKWQDDLAGYVPRLLKVGRLTREVEIVLFVDNVDQLSPAYQAQIFLLAQRVTRAVGCITIVSLREESYYTANLQRTLTAYTNRKFHIASPGFRRLIGSRIEFAIEALEKRTTLAAAMKPRGVAFDEGAVVSFLKIVEYSIFQRNRHIALFIESLCFGNMRMALEMFTTFLVSGATDVDKMLAIYQREGAYFVAFHEFVKSIMLGDRKYYKESESPLLNLFDCGADRNSSHFTGLRILSFLLSQRGQASREGQGYTEVARLIGLFEDVFDNRGDVVRTLNKLVVKQLVEVNTRSRESIDGASHVRVTSAGWYYRRYLAGVFPYLDLVLQDTPLSDEGTANRLRDSVARVDNLGDKEGEKDERMQVRFGRVAEFLAYLSREEEDEQAGRDLAAIAGVVGERIVPKMVEGFEGQRAWIERRLRENRERFEDDLLLVGGAGAGGEGESDEAALFDPSSGVEGGES